MPRTIEAPGVEWKEIDLSQNTAAITGTYALVMGYASKGEDERPMIITSNSSWQTVFGQPTNEAERYFYSACMKVLNQSGSLIAAKIPYKNKSKGKYIGVDFSLEPYDEAYFPGSGGGRLESGPDSQLTPIQLFYNDFYDSENYEVSTGITTVSGTGTSGETTAYVYEKVGINQNIQRAVNFECQGIMKMSEDALNVYRVGQVPEWTETTIYGENIRTEKIDAGHFRIIDITRSTLTKDNLDEQTIGIFPVVVAAGNVFPLQNILENKLANSLGDDAVWSVNGVKSAKFQSFCPVWNLKNHVASTDEEFGQVGPVLADGVDLTNDIDYLSCNVDPNSAMLFSSQDVNAASFSRDLLSLFPTMTVQEDGSLDRDYLGRIMIAVVKAYVDPLNANKVNYQVMETFIGSPWKGDIDKSTGATIYLGDLINGTSNYIEFYSNLEGMTNFARSINDLYLVNFGYQNAENTLENNANKAAYLTPFTINETKKYCSASQIIQSIQSIFDKVSNINAQQVDLVIDAGLSNIAQFVTTNHNPNAAEDSGDDADGAINFYDPVGLVWKLRSRNDTLQWRSIYALYNTFCSTTRKDCMFIFDGLRPLCLEGSQKLVRPTKPSNTIDTEILTKLNYVAGLNTSYGCGELTWDYVTDDFTGAFFWRPPSIAKAGCIIYTDNVANYWDAPAGLNRGIVSDATDIAFNPTMKQAGEIYKKGWNYMINWPADGITCEGQKTLQVKSSAFDRINVRRLFLRLERATYQTARYYVYEPNNAFTRQRFIDAIDPLFSNAKIGGGIYDYKIKCDDGNNTPTVIDANEMVIDIAIKPTRTAEFILCNFYALRTDGSWSEAGM